MAWYGFLRSNTQWGKVKRNKKCFPLVKLMNSSFSMERASSYTEYRNSLPHVGSYWFRAAISKQETIAVGKNFPGMNSAFHSTEEGTKDPLLQLSGVFPASCTCTVCQAWLAGETDPRSGWPQRLQGAVVRSCSKDLSWAANCSCQERKRAAPDQAQGPVFEALWCRAKRWNARDLWS